MLMAEAVRYQISDPHNARFSVHDFSERVRLFTNFLLHCEIWRPWIGSNLDSKITNNTRSAPSHLYCHLAILCYLSSNCANLHYVQHRRTDIYTLVPWADIDMAVQFVTEPHVAFWDKNSPRITTK